MKHALIDKNGLVVSVIIWPDGNFTVPRDHQSIKSDVVHVGDKYDGNNFIKPDGSFRQ